jgi:hypothetical protein
MLHINGSREVDMQPYYNIILNKYNFSISLHNFPYNHMQGLLIVVKFIGNFTFSAKKQLAGEIENLEECKQK